MLADLGQRLEQLMPAENSFSYKRTLKPIPIMDVHFSLLKAKSLCLAGVRSRYGNDSSNNTFTIRVTKAGILDRKYDLIQNGKKATARGWRPFGIILSGSQIIFFADLSSYQTWLEKEENPSTSELASKRNNSFPAFSSIPESSSSSSVNATVNSLSSLYTHQETPIPTTSSQSSSTTTASFLRPVQIVSLSYAICICDEEYTKYPHVFRLITGDGQQFLLRADNDKDMEDWMLKINYAATLKTTGVRMRPTRRPNDTKEYRYNTDKLKREEKAKDKVQELSDRIDEQVKLLDRELQLRRNLMVLTPYQKSTKDRILSFAETLGKTIKTKRIELQRLICYRDYLECELSFSTSQNQQSRKLSLPLPTHLYAFQQPSSTAQKKLSSLIFTTENETPPISNTSTSSTSSSHHHAMMESSSAISQEDEEDDDDDKGVKSISSDSQSSSYSANEEDSSTPQLPSFSFPKSFIESLSFMDAANVKTASDKAVEMDRIMRRRSQSNPVLPNIRPIIDKKLLLEPPSRGRQRSGSEASSVKEDDDDMSVIIVNDSEELLTDTSHWPTTPTN